MDGEIPSHHILQKYGLRVAPQIAYLFVAQQT